MKSYDNLSLMRSDLVSSRDGRADHNCVAAETTTHISGYIQVTDEETIKVTRDLAKYEGVFVGYDSLRGESIKVRFIWSGISETTARWEQAFSPDDGQTWETNSIMEFTRDDKLPDIPTHADL